MKRLFIFLSLVFIYESLLFGAVAPDMRISDNDGDVLEISTSGTLAITNNNSSGSAIRFPAQDIRISDNNGRVASVNSDGTLLAKWQ